MSPNSQVLGHRLLHTFYHQSQVTHELINHYHITYHQSSRTWTRAGLAGGCFFTETNSHHTVQILKSFIIVHYMTGNKYFLISFSCTILLYKFKFFVFMGIAKLHEIMTCIHANIMKKFCRIHAKLPAKKLFISNEAQFREKLVSYLYENDAEFRAKKSFRPKPRNCCARELTVPWKP